MPPPRPIRKSKGPTGPNVEQIRGRQRGALLGLAVGEAMGVKTDRRQLSADPFPQLMDGPWLEPRGGGEYELRPGQVSWGAEMAQVLSTTLRNVRAYDVLETGRAYRRWSEAVQPPERVPEVVRQVVAHLVDGRSPEFTGRRVWLENFQKVKDNAALVRTAPIGLYFFNRREERALASFEDTAITHFDPLCQVAAATFNGLLANAVSTPGERMDPEQLLKVFETELSYVAALLGRREPDWVAQTKLATETLREDMQLAQQDDPELYGPDLHLFLPWPSLLRTTWRLAFWELFHAPSLEAAIVDVVNRGGDACANAAVTGALFGAIFGEAAVPSAWSELVLEAPGQQPWHPRNLVTLAGLTPDG